MPNLKKLKGNPAKYSLLLSQTMHVLAFDGSCKEEMAYLAACILRRLPSLSHQKGFSMVDSQDSKDLEVILKLKIALLGNSNLVKYG